jgi:hypothetical protein
MNEALCLILETVSLTSPRDEFETRQRIKRPHPFGKLLNVAKWVDGQKADPVLSSRIIDYILRHGDDISFTGYFWKRCEPIPYELDRYSKYSKVLSLFAKGRSAKEISIATRVNSFSVWSWTRFKQKPKLAHYLMAFIKLGKPESGYAWLSVSNTSRNAIPKGPFVQVPLQIVEWSQARNVLSQLRLGEENNREPELDYRFGFLLGVMMGDASKKRQKKWHRHIELTMSKKYETNLRIGDFTAACANAMGLRMRRTKDRPPYSGKPNGFYEWNSQSSALVDWMFNVCLGLKDGELTTYNPVRMDWALGGPIGFRRGLIQGIAESDGSLNLPGQEVEFWIGPNWDFMSRLLETFGIKSFVSHGALAVSKTQVVRAYEVPVFAPHLRTPRFTLLEKLAKADHIQHGRRVPLGVRTRISELATMGMSVPTISKHIVDEFGTILTYEAVQRWARQVEPPGSGQSMAEATAAQ